MLQLKSKWAVRAAVLVLVASGAVARDATAQVFVGAGAGVSMPDAAPVVPSPPQQIAPTTVLRHMPRTLDGWQLNGENGDIMWPLYMSRAQAGGALRFRIAYVSAVSVLPDESKLSVRINDREIGSEPVDAPNGLRSTEFSIPSGLLVEGYNAIRVTVRQRHRVDCSVAATYELWTKIDPVQTGLVVSSDVASIASVADLPALALRTDGSLPIHIIQPGKTSPAHLQHLLAATSAVAVAAHALQPVVDFDPSASESFGIDLAVGTRAALAQNPKFSPALDTASSSLVVIPGGVTGRPTLLVTASSEAALDQAIASIAIASNDNGSESGVIAAHAYPGYVTDGSETLALRQLGVQSEEFSGRHSRKSFSLALPADVLASDYARGTFDLAGAYASGLSSDAQIRVDVNGKNSGVIKLPSQAGDVFRHNRLFLPLGLMRPGLNRIDVYADTPRQGDAACEASDGKRFLFSDLSKIELPTLARVLRLPELAVTAAGGLPFANGARLVVPKPDRGTMGSALSITARLSVAAGKVIPFEFSTRMPRSSAGSTLIVAPARSLDPAVMTKIGLDPNEVETAWRDAAQSRFAAARRQDRWWWARSDGPSACTLPPLEKAAVPPANVEVSKAQGVPPAISADATADNEDLLDAWDEARHPRLDWRATFDAAVARSRAWIEAWSVYAQERVAGASRSQGIVSNTSLLIAQGVNSGTEDAVTMIVTAPNAEILQASVPCLFDPQVWSKVGGRMSQLDASNGSVTTTASRKFHYTIGPQTSLSNTRLVIAGWFSIEPVAFVGIAMFLAISLSGTTLWFVRGVGRRSE